MTDKKELNNEELEKVAGGTHQEDISALPTPPERHLDQHEARNYIGQVVYVIDDDNHFKWARGFLLSSCDVSTACGSEIIHTIDVRDFNYQVAIEDDDGRILKSPGVHKFCGDDTTLYLCNQEYFKQIYK